MGAAKEAGWGGGGQDPTAHLGCGKPRSLGHWGRCRKQAGAQGLMKGRFAKVQEGPGNPAGGEMGGQGEGRGYCLSLQRAVWRKGGCRTEATVMVKALEELTPNLSPSSLHPCQCLPLANTPGAGEAGHASQPPGPAQAREGCRMAAGGRGGPGGRSDLPCPPLQGRDSLPQAAWLAAQPPFPS